MPADPSRPRPAGSTPPSRLSLERIAAAHGAIDPQFRDTPQLMMESLNDRLGCRLVAKVETLTPIRSFKGRGAQFFVSQLSQAPHLVAATAGNFGQGMAWAARARGCRFTAFTSTDANPLKLDRMRRFGAEVRTAPGDLDAVHAAARAYATATGALLVQDGREPAIAEGAGTIGLELLRWPEPFDAIVVPLGDGALLGGTARWVKAHSPATRMIGICAETAPAMAQSWRHRMVESRAARTIADGIAIQTPFAESVADLVALVDDILLVPDDLLIESMRLIHGELGLVLEPSGAAGIAAMLAHGAQFRGQRIATILTGGNPTQDQLRLLSGR
jgi:threonine dehydratase